LLNFLHGAVGLTADEQTFEDVSDWQLQVIENAVNAACHKTGVFLSHSLLTFYIITLQMTHLFTKK